MPPDNLNTRQQSAISRRVAILSILLLSGGFHILSAWLIPGVLINDSYYYYHCAESIIENGVFLVGEYRTPGCPLFYAGLFKLFGKQVDVISISQHLLALLTTFVAVAFLPKRVSTMGCLSVGLAFGCNPFLSFSASYVMSESLFGCVTALGIAFLITDKFNDRKRLFYSGVFLGLACLVRANGLVTCMVTIGYLLTRPILSFIRNRAFTRGEIEKALWFGYWAFLMTLPWLIFRMVWAGEFALTERHITPSIHMEMALWMDHAHPEFFKDQEIETEWNSMEEWWRQLPPEYDKRGSSFYYYVTPTLVEKFGQPRVTVAYKNHFSQWIFKYPFVFIHRFLSVLTLQLSAVPPPMFDSILPDRSVQLKEIETYLMKPDKYLELLTSLYGKRPMLEAVQRTSPGKYLIRRIFVEYSNIWLWIQFLAVWIFVLRIMWLLSKKHRCDLESVFPISLFFAQGLVLAYLMSPVDRYSLPFWPFVILSLALLENYSDTKAVKI